MAVFIIAEAGSNWWADDNQGLSRAQSLIRAAAEAGADACKFQFWSKGRVYAQGASEYGDLGDVEELFRKLALPESWLPDLAALCSRSGIEFMASVFSPADVAAVDPYVKRHKIASYELGHHELIAAAVATGKEVIISTGAATAAEVERTRFAFPQERVKLLHCVADYPAPFAALNLRVIADGHYAGYSDHSEGIIAPIVAAVLGATIIEKHFTLCKKLAGPDHKFALEPDELCAMVDGIRQAEMMLGDSEKCVMSCEEKLRKFAVRRMIDGAMLRPGNR